MVEYNIMILFAVDVEIVKLNDSEYVLIANTQTLMGANINGFTVRKKR